MKRYVAIVALALALGFAGGAAWSQQVDVSTLPFSTARKAGQTLYVSGQIPATPEGTIVKGDIQAQMRQTMQNIGRVLEENGYAFADVVSVTVYLSDMKHYADMNAAYREFFSGPFPARACVGGLQLALGADMEISAIAVK